VATSIRLTELELSILRVLHHAGPPLPTGQIASSIPTHQNGHEHSALIRTWLQKLQSNGLVKCHVAYRMTAWELTEPGRGVLKAD
jgi:repressor of nif and glnA expression